MTADIYQIKVTLLDTTPPIWRRVLVPSDLKLPHLHKVIQIAMGWENYHLHEFRIGGERYGVPDPDYPKGEPGLTNEKNVVLSDLLSAAGAEVQYIYDFGDGWEHSLVVEKIVAPDSQAIYPQCIDGERNCPPEDCGGVYGYFAFLEAFFDPKHEQHEEMVDWIGGRFDPTAFSAEAVNKRLARLQRPRAKKRDQRPQSSGASSA